MGLSKTTYIFLITAALFSIAAGSATADTVNMNDGKEIKGIVVEDYKDRVTLSTADGEQVIMKAEIRELFYDTEEQNLIKLAEQAREKGYIAKSYAYYDKAFKINPGSKQAKDGMVLLQGQLFKKDVVQKEEAVNRLNDIERYGPSGAIAKSSDDMLSRNIEKLKTTIGVTLISTGQVTKFESVSEGSPAYESGIRRGDTLLAIWGKLAGYMSLKEVVEEILKKASFEIRCSIERSVNVGINENRNMLSKSNDMIGAVLKMQFDGLTISSVKEFGPAAEAGLRENDLISSIDGRSTRYMPLKNAVELIKRSKGNTIDLIIRRDVVIWPKEGR